MKTVGIICEYNPFHLGHLRQFHLIRHALGENCRIVCVMSGNYVQRGIPAMWDKYTRAKTALNCGADLVLELPITGVLQSAEGFAGAGVDILSQLGCVEYLSFGAECGDGDRLMTMAHQIDTAGFQAKLLDGLKRGLSYAAARQQALQDTGGLLSSPNNILGLEYCRAILRQKSNLKPLVIPRNGDYHACKADPEAPSATAVRSLFPQGNWKEFIPAEAASALETAPWYDLSFGERAVLSRLRAMTDEEWAQCAHGSEGLWSKAMKASRSQPTLDAIVEQTKSKRYPRTRIQRLLLCAYLGITDEMLQQPFPYVRILAASDDGRSLLRQAKDRDGLFLLTPGQKAPDTSYFRLECRCADLFSLFATPGFSPDCRMEETGRILLSEK